MHELALAQELLQIMDQVVEEHRLKQVTQITLEVGVLSNVVQDALRFSFEVLVPGTVYEKAELVLEEVPVHALCKDCSHEYQSWEVPFCCSACQSPKASILGGTDLVIANLLGEEGTGR